MDTPSLFINWVNPFDAWLLCVVEVCYNISHWPLIFGRFINTRFWSHDLFLSRFKVVGPDDGRDLQAQEAHVTGSESDGDDAWFVHLRIIWFHIRIVHSVCFYSLSNMPYHIWNRLLWNWEEHLPPLSDDFKLVTYLDFQWTVSFSLGFIGYEIAVAGRNQKHWLDGKFIFGD